MPHESAHDLICHFLRGSNDVFCAMVRSCGAQVSLSCGMKTQWPGASNKLASWSHSVWM